MFASNRADVGSTFVLRMFEAWVVFEVCEDTAGGSLRSAIDTSATSEWTVYGITLPPCGATEALLGSGSIEFALKGTASELRKNLISILGGTAVHHLINNPLFPMPASAAGGDGFQMNPLPLLRQMTYQWPRKQRFTKFCPPTPPAGSHLLRAKKFQRRSIRRKYVPTPHRAPRARSIFCPLHIARP